MIVWIDESGNHNLDPKKSDGVYEWFILGAAFFSKKNYEIFDKDFRNLKKEMFGKDSFILHTAEITRPNKSKDELNLKFNCPEFRREFYEKIGKLIERTEFKVAFCAVNKERLVDLYGIERAADPYHFSIENILNRSLREAAQDTVSIYPEKRDTKSNKLLEIEILRLKTNGTKFYSAHQLVKRIKVFSLREKSHNDSGAQLIDLLVTPVGRYCAKKKPKPAGNEITFCTFKSKIPEGCFTVFPKSKKPAAPQKVL